MKLNVKTSVTMSEDEVGILDATAARLGISRNEVMRHLIIYQGMCGGDFPLTTKILALPPATREKVIAEIRRRSECGEASKSQSFRDWVKEVIGSSDASALERGADAILRKLLES